MKGNEALIEFLLTYGWAIFCVIAVLFALVYFNVLTPSFLSNQLLVEECTTKALYCSKVMTCNFTNGSVVI